MPLHLKVSVDGADELEARLRGLRPKLEREQRAAMHRAVILVRDQARSMIHSPEGRARRGIRSDVIGAGDTLRGMIRAKNRAAIFAQRGRGPGKAPRVRKIRAWLRRIGAEDSRSSAFLVARAIGQRGMQGEPAMEAALDAKRGQVVALWREFIRRVLRER